MKYREITSQKTIYKHKISCNSVSTFRKASNSSSQSYQSKSLIFTALYPLPVLMIPLHYNAARFSQENQSDWKYDGVSQKCCDRASNRSDLESFSHTKPLKHLKQLLWRTKMLPPCKEKIWGGVDVLPLWEDEMPHWTVLAFSTHSQVLQELEARQTLFPQCPHQQCQRRALSKGLEAAHPGECWGPRRQKSFFNFC